MNNLILKKDLNQLNGVNDDFNTNGELLVLESIIKNNSTVFDVGARDSLIPKIGDNNKFYLFEPILNSYRRLVSEYEQFENVKLINNCLSDKTETITIDLYTECVNFRPGQPNNSMGTEEIHCITLENYLKDNDINYIDLLKIDVEGYEFNVIKGLGSYIKNVKYIMFEYGVGTYSSNNVKLSDVVTLLGGFNLFLVQNNGLIKLNLNDTTQYDLISSLGYCNLLAENKN